MRVKRPDRMPARPLNPEKLHHSPWTAVVPQNREKHFLVTKLIRDADEIVTACVIEAVLTQRSQQIDWRELKDFIEDRLGLEVDEFNRKPIAGITNITRLSEMLDVPSFQVGETRLAVCNSLVHCRRSYIGWAFL